jgi:hypothetical protein
MRRPIFRFENRMISFSIALSEFEPLTIPKHVLLIILILTVQYINSEKEEGNDK